MANDVSKVRLIRFGTFELDVPSGELRKGGTRLNLQEQPLQFLLALLQRPGELVSREELVQRLWASHTFVDFEHGLNAAVKRMRDTLGDSAETPRFIETVPRRGYRFIAPVEIVEAGGSARPSRRSYASGRIIVASTAAVVVVALTALLSGRLPRSNPGEALPPHVLTLTSMNGFEAGEIAPDGQHLVFESDGEQANNRDIYVKLIGAPDVQRLTTDPAPDLGPAWSHDGRQITYVRLARYGFQPGWGFQPGSRVRVMSALGGGDRQVRDVSVSVPARWSPDDRYVVAGHVAEPGGADPSNGVYLIPLEGGEPRALTRPKPPEVHYAPAFSPDARHLAFISCDDSTNLSCGLYVLDVNPAYKVISTPRRVAPSERGTSIMGVTWSADSKSLIYGANSLGFSYLWRVAIEGEARPERIEAAGESAAFPKMAPGGDRLTFSRFVDDPDIYRVQRGRPAEPIVRSTQYDGNVQFSGDGHRIAFCSQRNVDTLDVWAANADGSSPTQLTHGPNRWQCSPAWSPDGQHVAFDSQSPDGSWHIWIVDSQGGSLQQVTNYAGDQNHPTWSHDGNWLYYVWRQPDAGEFWQRDVWRTHRVTGVKEQVTRDGHAVAVRESADGRMVFYQTTLPKGPLMAMARDGGTGRVLVTCSVSSGLAVTAGAVYYIPCENEFPAAPLVRSIDPVTRMERDVGRLEDFGYATNPGTFAVSPDGQTILYGRQIRSGADVIMIEHFR